MDINWIGGISGGVLIGLSAALLLFFNGRIAGISGIAGSLILNKPLKDSLWKLLFILGLLIGAGLYTLITGDLQVQLQANRTVLIIAGLLVGVGTRLGSGCTSGHGVCGIARRSKRSITATVVFMVVAILTVFIKQSVGL